LNKKKKVMFSLLTSSPSSKQLRMWNVQFGSTSNQRIESALPQRGIIPILAYSSFSNFINLLSGTINQITSPCRNNTLIRTKWLTLESYG
jgi:hypothetical protein